MKRVMMLALVLLIVFSQANGGRAQTAAPVEINAVIPLTGGGAFLGKAYLQAFTALETVVNRGGGIQGHPIKFVYADSQTNPQVSLQLVNGLIARHVNVFIDGAPAGVCSASIPIVVSTGPVDYCLSPGVHPPARSYVFSSNVSTDDLGKTLVRYFRDRGWVRIAAITSTDTTGQDFDRILDGTLALQENRSLQLLVHEHFAPTDISVAAQMARIKASNPQVLVTWSTGTPFGTLLHGIIDAGLDVPVVSSSGNELRGQMTAYAGIVPKELLFPGPLAITPPASERGPVRNAQDVYFRAFHAMGVNPDLAHALAWDPALIIVDALRKLGPTATPLQIRDYILSLHNWPGINGFYDFTTGDQRGLGVNAVAVQRWDAGKNDWVQVSRPGGAKL
jgi:branched-chain amino acid transport system substrate-binding protein